MIRKSLIATIILCAGTHSAFAAAPSQTHSDQLLTTPTVKQVMLSYWKAQQSASQKSDYVIAKLKTMDAEQASRVKALQSKERKLPTELRQLINTSSDQVVTYFNPFVQQLSEATAFINGIRVCASYTDQLLLRMREIAIDVASNPKSPDDLIMLNQLFQGIINNSIPAAQTMHLLDGDKVVSHGGLKVTMGDAVNNSNTISIPVPAFTPEVLGITNLRVDSVNSASDAVIAIDRARKQIELVLNAAQSQKVGDAVAMLWIAASRLEDSMKLMYDEKDFAELATNAFFTDNERVRFNDFIADDNDLIQASQTYVSLWGPKMLGLGDIHIQIGNQDSPESTLDVKLPVTDVHLTGLDTIDLATVDKAKQSLNLIKPLLKKIVYSQA